MSNLIDDNGQQGTDWFQKLVIRELNSIKETQDYFNDEFNKFKDDVYKRIEEFNKDFNNEITDLKIKTSTRSSMWGLVGGALPVIAMFVYLLLNKS